MNLKEKVRIIEQKEIQEIAMEIIIQSSHAKKASLEANQFSRNHAFEDANNALSKASFHINKAHEEQTRLLTIEANGTEIKFSLLLVHAQDHLMNAIMFKELATEFMNLYASK